MPQQQDAGPRQVVITVHQGVMQVQITHGMDKVEALGMMGLAEYQMSAHGPNGFIGGVERAPADFLKKLPEPARPNGNGIFLPGG